jgi:hypothetical protein
MIFRNKPLAGGRVYSFTKVAMDRVRRDRSELIGRHVTDLRCRSSVTAFRVVREHFLIDIRYRQRVHITRIDSEDISYWSHDTRQQSRGRS